MDQARDHGGGPNCIIQYTAGIFHVPDLDRGPALLALGPHDHGQLHQVRVHPAHQADPLRVEDQPIVEFLGEVKVGPGCLVAHGVAALGVLRDPRKALGELPFVRGTGDHEGDWHESDSPVMIHHNTTGKEPLPVDRFGHGIPDRVGLGPSDHVRAQHGVLLMVVIVAVFWILIEYFVPVKLLQFHLFTHIPLALTLIVYLYRIDIADMSGYLAYLRRGIVGVSILLIGADIIQLLTMAPEPQLFRSLLKTVEVSVLYVFVVQFARYYRMSPAQSVVKLDFIKRATAQAVLALVLFFVSAPSVSAFSLTTRIGDQSTELKAGDRLYFDVEIKWPENDRRQDLRVEYQILSDGEVIASEKVLRAVETQASFLDYIVVPQNALEGIKELNVLIETYDQSLS